LMPIVIPGTDTAQKRRKASCLGGQFLSINEISRISDDSTSHQASVIRRGKSKQCNMQSSPPFISFTTQEEGTDDDRYRGKEEDSTILKENVSAQEEKHVKTMRDDVHDSIPQPSERCGRRKLSQFPEKLMRILDSKEYEDIISWNKEGNAIAIHEPYDLVSEVLTTHFEARDDMKFDSFVRKLYRWGFSKLVVDEGENIYFHPYFRQGDHESCSKIFCTSKPTSTRPRRRERNEMSFRYIGQNETLDLAGFQSQMLSSSHFNGNPLDSNARLSPQNQESGAAFPVNHNIGALADSFLGSSKNTAAPNQHQWYDNGGAMTPDEIDLRLLHMNTMTNGGQSSVSAAEMQYQQMGSGINSIQNHHQITGREGLPASVPNSLTTSQQNFTLSAASSSSRMPGHHIPFQPPSFLHGTKLFQTADYSQLLGNDSTYMTMSQEIEELRKGNDLILQFTKNLLHDRSVSPRQYMPQLLNGINISSTPTMNSIIDSAVQRQPMNNILLGGTNLIQNNPNQISATHAASSDHTFREMEALQHAKQVLSGFQESGMPALERIHQSAHLVRHDKIVLAAGITLTNNGLQTNCAAVRTFQQQPEESNILPPAPDQSKSPPADRSQAGGSIQLNETGGMNEKLSRSSSETNNNIGSSSQRRRLS